MGVLMNITPALCQALEQNNLTVMDLTPAYNGESASLDLYNAGPDIVIPALLVENLTAQFSAVRERTDSNAHPQWVDLPEEVRKNYYKVLIPTGLKVSLRHDQAGVIKERSSITKTPLVLRAGVIDSGYTDQIYINAVNLSPYDIVIKAGEKTPFQLVVQIIDNNFINIPDDVFARRTEVSDRKAGKIGSSDGAYAQ
jgi:dUTPase